GRGGGVLSRIRVLIADDDPVLRDALAALIQAEESMELVGVATDAGQVVELAGTLAPDVAVIDVRMPEGGGAAAARGIRQVSPSTRIVALSAYEDRTTVLEMLRAGAVGYVVKGTSTREIAEAISRSYLGQSTLSAEITTDVVDELASQLVRESKEAERQAERAARIRRVLAGEGLTMVFQPIADLLTGRIVGLEALARFSLEPQQGPDRWFAEAAEVGLAIDLELAAARAALAHFDHVPQGAYLSVNLSPETVTFSSFRDIFINASVDRVVVEITEHAPVQDYAALADALGEFRNGGGRLAVDDAGAGFASLRHILRLAPDLIKLDVTLTRNIDSDQASQAMASALASFASKTHARIVAEGIETQEELAALRDLGIDHGQGYLLARPGPLPLTSPYVPALAASTKTQASATG
ncbi:MAG TPA: EAL domain-containing protein, partial [Actinomycetota bacterium]|nr:EAL domain-containing protein [Actinomycetota bacterium]